MNKLFYLILFPIFVFGSGTSGDYDIVPRTINFLIFSAILYYVVANPFKNFVKNRTNSISLKLESIQKKLLDSKSKKLESMKKLEDAKIESANAIALAKKEAEIIADNIKNEAKEELSLMEKHFEEKKLYEIRKMQREVISASIDKIFSDKSLNFSQDEIVDLISRKVS